MTTIDQVDEAEVAIEMRMVELITAANFIHDKLRDNFSRETIVKNVASLEYSRDRLCIILRDVGGKS